MSALKVTIESDLNEKLLKCRVWLRQHFSYVYTDGWTESRFSFTVSLTGRAQEWVKTHIAEWLARDLRKQIIDEVTLAKGVPSDILTGRLVEPKSPGVWWDEIPRKVRHVRRQVSDRDAARSHSVPVR